MPEISRFLGIIIAMFYKDHAPPHFHAIYGEYEITVEIESGVINGRFPRRALRLVLEWLELHKDELLENWQLAEEKKPLKKSPHWSNVMIPKVIDAKYVEDYTLFLRFSDGSEGEVDLQKELEGAIFEPLKDINYFKKFSVNQELHTVVWPNGADFAPEYLYENLKVPA